MRYNYNFTLPAEQAAAFEDMLQDGVVQVQEALADALVSGQNEVAECLREHVRYLQQIKRTVVASATPHEDGNSTDP